MPTLIRRSGFSRKDPVFYYLIVYKSEEVEEDTLAKDESRLLSENVLPILKYTQNLQMMLFTRKSIDVHPQAINAVGRVEVMLYIPIRVHVLRCKVRVAVCDPSKHGQYLINVTRYHGPSAPFRFGSCRHSELRSGLIHHEMRSLGVAMPIFTPCGVKINITRFFS
jgi:hypothetical protein